MPDIYVSTSGVWKKITSAFVSSSGVWKKVTDGYVSSAGVWKKFFQSAISPSIAQTVAISRNNATYPSTLTGTNYRWTNSTSLSYVFQKSSDNSAWTNIGTATSIANPSVGSSNTVTYALTIDDMPAYTSYYRFVVTASNSTYSTSTTSTSSSVSVNQPAPINTVAPTITPASGTIGVTEFSVNSNGTWNPVDTDGVYTYLWQSSDTPTYVSAPGTNNLSTYTPPSNFFTLGYSSPIRCRVTATNASGSTSAFSNTATVSPPKPSGGSVTLSGSGAAGRNITATTSGWSGSPTSYSVRIYARATNPPVPDGIGTVLKASSASSSVSYQVTTFDATNPPYYFKAFATATNAAGTSTDEAESSVILSFLPTVPGLVTSFTSFSSLSGSTLSWNATWSAPTDDGGADITTYRVYVERATSSSGPWLASTTSISGTAGGTYSGAYTASSPFSTANANTPRTIYGRVTGTAATWIRVFVAGVNSAGTGSYNTAVG
jgi:hypothetical protein